MIILKKDGFYKNSNIVNFDFNFFINWESLIEIEEVNLNNIINIITEDSKAFKMLERLTSSNIYSYLKEIKKDIDNCKHEYILIEKNYILVNKDLDCTNSCSGYINGEACALEFEKWNNIKNLPIKINYFGKFSNGTKDIEINSIFSVSDFFNALFGEICFFKTPNVRDDELNNLKNIIKGIEDGTVKTHPWNLNK